MFDGVIEATRKACRKVNMSLNDIDLFEVNEAFAVVPITWLKTLGIDKTK